MPKLERLNEKLTHDFRKKIGVLKDMTFGGSFNGNAVRKIFDNASVLRGMTCDAYGKPRDKKNVAG